MPFSTIFFRSLRSGPLDGHSVTWKEFNWRLAKRPLKTNGRLANRQLTSLAKEDTAAVRFGTV